MNVIRYTLDKGGLDAEVEGRLKELTTTFKASFSGDVLTYLNQTINNHVMEYARRVIGEDQPIEFYAAYNNSDIIELVWFGLLTEAIRNKTIIGELTDSGKGVCLNKSIHYAVAAANKAYLVRRTPESLKLVNTAPNLEVSDKLYMIQLLVDTFDKEYSKLSNRVKVVWKRRDRITTYAKVINTLYACGRAAV